MRLIVLDTPGAECVYLAHQILFLKILSTSATLRFQGDLTLYWLEKDNALKLFDWLARKDSDVVKVKASLHAP